jgi:D-serine deaminase-like pyridoxal phosphate-dependent protein
MTAVQTTQMPQQATTLAQLETPCAVVDEMRMQRNINRLHAHLDALDVTLRAHLKTAKSVEVSRRVMATPRGPAAVSTVKEAEQFLAAGVTDLTYAVGIEPVKLKRIMRLRKEGADIAVLLDSVAQARFVAEAARVLGDAIPAFIELDCDGHRSGVAPGDAKRLLAIGQALAEGGELRGVLTHAGESYFARGASELVACAENERHGAVTAATTLRQAELDCPVVSVGSTPTAHFAKDLTGITELRAGVFVFFDLVMAGISVCRIDDIALSVLATVIGHQEEKDWIIVDAGWMAMSRDRGTANQDIDQGYGVVCDLAGRPYPDLIVSGTNQEHGIIAIRDGSSASLPDLPIGARVRILPNHACATGAQHDRYHVVYGASEKLMAEWGRFGGW